MPIPKVEKSNLRYARPTPKRKSLAPPPPEGNPEPAGSKASLSSSEGPEPVNRYKPSTTVGSPEPASLKGSATPAGSLEPTNPKLRATTVGRPEPARPK